jgi:hypothetical protein
VILVRASVVLTNHKNEPRMVAVRVALKDSAGAVLASGEETLTVQAAELSCHCDSVPVRSAALPSCDYTCNY